MMPSFSYRAAPLLVLALLLFTTLACYSDSPLWFGGQLTATPQLATPLPIPSGEQARLQPGDRVLVAVRVDQPSVSLSLTNFPEPLKIDLSNRAPQSCSPNTPVTILHSALQENSDIYYLIDCNGAVGWAEETNFTDPVAFVVGERALTTEAGVENGFYKIEAANPPYDPNNPARQRYDCRVNDTVDIVDMTGFSSGELYYKIRCTNPINPVAPNIGWTTPAALFGPIRFRSGETGVVARDEEQVELTAAPQDSEVTATCDAGELVTISEQPVQRIENELFYEMTCAGGTGWANQTMILGPVRYLPGTQVLVTALPLVAEPATATTPTSTPDGLTELQNIGEALDPLSTAEPAPVETAFVLLTTEPGTVEEAGRCTDATLTEVEIIAGVEETVYARVTCEEATGWLRMADLYGEAFYGIGETVPLGEKALLGFTQQGIYLSVEIFDIQGASGGSSVIAGECAFDLTTRTPIEATITDVGYYRSSLGAIVGIFYRATCQDRDGNTIEGWLNQARIGI